MRHQPEPDPQYIETKERLERTRDAVLSIEDDLRLVTETRDNEVRRAIQRGWSLRRIAEISGLSHSSIHRIRGYVAPQALDLIAPDTRSIS